MSVESLDMLVHNKIAWAQETTTISNVKSNLKRHIERISLGQLGTMSVRSVDILHQSERVEETH